MQPLRNAPNPASIVIDDYKCNSVSSSLVAGVNFFLTNNTTVFCQIEKRNSPVMGVMDGEV